MADDFHVEWDKQSFTLLMTGFTQYEGKVLEAVNAVGDYMAGVIEAYAKENAPWTDRTSNARQGLRGYTNHSPASGYPVDEFSETIVVLYLSHQVDYGVFLEYANQMRFAIILPTLEAHYQQIMNMLDAIFR